MLNPGNRVYIHSGEYAGHYATIDCETAAGIGVRIDGDLGRAIGPVNVQRAQVEAVKVAA